MGRLVRPVTRDPADHLMMPPDIPPRSEAAHTPPASAKRMPPEPRPAANPETPSRRGKGKGKEPERRPELAGAQRPLPGAGAQSQEEYEWDDIYDATPVPSPGEEPGIG